MEQLCAINRLLPHHAAFDIKWKLYTGRQHSWWFNTFSTLQDETFLSLAQSVLQLQRCFHLQFKKFQKMHYMFRLISKKIDVKLRYCRVIWYMFSQLVPGRVLEQIISSHKKHSSEILMTFWLLYKKCFHDNYNSCEDQIKA